MKKFLSYIHIIILSLCPISLFANGDWTVYNAISKINQIKLFEDRIYGVSGKSLISFSTDTNDLDYHLYSSNDGLTGKYVRFIATSNKAKCLAVIYDDCNIDIIHVDGSVTNLPDIANKPLKGDKTVNRVQEIDGSLYLSCSFGLLVVDLTFQIISASIATSYSIGFAFCYGQNIYRYSGAKQLEYCPLTKNLSDNNNWKSIITQRIVDVIVINGAEKYCWILDDNGQLWQLNNQDDIFQIKPENKFNSIYNIGTSAILAGEGFIMLAEPDKNAFTTNTDSPIKSGIGFDRNADDDFFMLHPNGNVYYMSIKEYIPNNTLTFNVDFENVMSPSGINTSFLGDIQQTDNGLISISRLSYISSYEAAHSLSGTICRYDADNDTWKNINTQEAISNRLQERKSFVGLTGLAVDPTDESRYAISSGMHGLYIMQSDTLLHRFDDLAADKYVEAFNNDFLSARVSAVTYDEEGRLFYTNALQDTVLRCLTTDGQCIKYPNKGMSKVKNARRILISKHDKNRIKWVLNDYGYQESRIGMYYDQGTPTTVGTSTYQSTWFSALVDQDFNKYHPNYIYDLYEAADGKVWILTNIGPFVIENTKTTFEYAQNNLGMGKVRRIKVPRNDGTNLADYLLQSTECTCMTIDKNNNKWIGTNGEGVYVLSEDCLTEIMHFTTDNSPLLSDDILALSYDPQSKKTYISCDGGVLTYNTSDIEGEETLKGVYCYPNPVRPDYLGDLHIKNLKDNSRVSITAPNGDLVFRTMSQGGTVTWNLLDESSNRIKPGVYLINAIDTTGKEGQIIKILVL